LAPLLWRGGGEVFLKNVGEVFGAVRFTFLSTFVRAIRCNLFLPQRQAKKGFPLLSRSPSAENLYSAFTKAEIEAEIET
jgi:hypothetical protein